MFHSMTEHCCPGDELRESRSSPTLLSSLPLLQHWQLLCLWRSLSLSLFFFSFFFLYNCGTLLWRRKPREAVPLSESRLPELHASWGAFSVGPAAVASPGKVSTLLGPQFLDEQMELAGLRSLRLWVPLDGWSSGHRKSRFPPHSAETGGKGSILALRRDCRSLLVLFVLSYSGRYLCCKRREQGACSGEKEVSFSLC